MICLLYRLSCFSLCQQRNEFCKCIEQEIMDTMFGNNILSLFNEHLVQSMAQPQAVIVVLEDKTAYGRWSMTNSSTAETTASKRRHGSSNW